ncbi:CbtA family protein [Azospirillum sp. B2RO_4]|uniref:CbtA family protein n=1 Tax=Azospirillum sp. B2RO_4 TaxID=3027796 RepID=UPI003DA97D20
MVTPPAGSPESSHQHGPVREIGEGVPTTLDEAIQRIGLTIVANLLTGVAYALLLGAAILLAGRPVDARRGLVWGMGGFVAVSLAPSFGLAPELPGMAGAELELRQLWWLSAAAGAGAGLAALAFARNRLVIAAAILVAALPHLIGAPIRKAPKVRFRRNWPPASSPPLSAGPPCSGRSWARPAAG